MSSLTPFRSCSVLVFLDGRFMVPCFVAFAASRFFAAALAAHFARGLSADVLGLGSYGTICMAEGTGLSGCLRGTSGLGVSNGCLQFILRRRLGESVASAAASSGFTWQSLLI